MANPEKRGKPCTSQQWKGTIGLSLMIFAIFAIAVELPKTLAISLGVGEIVGLLLATISAGICFYTPHSNSGYIGGRGALCQTCQMPVLIGTYHCDVCEICVPAHSHHSDWLNSCIGASNYSAYLLCLFGIGTVAICQILASTVLIVLIATDQNTARRIVYRYSLLDQGYLYRLFIFFYFLISVTLAATTWVSFAYHLSKTVAQWKDQRKTRTQIKPVLGMNRLNPSCDTGLPVLPIAMLNRRDESLDSHWDEISGIEEKCRDGQSGFTQIPSPHKKTNN